MVGRRLPGPIVAELERVAEQRAASLTFAWRRIERLERRAAMRALVALAAKLAFEHCVAHLEFLMPGTGERRYFEIDEAESDHVFEQGVAGREVQCVEVHSERQGDVALQMMATPPGVSIGIALLVVPSEECFAMPIKGERVAVVRGHKPVSISFHRLRLAHLTDVQSHRPESSAERRLLSLASLAEAEDEARPARALDEDERHLGHRECEKPVEVLAKLADRLCERIRDDAHGRRPALFGLVGQQFDEQLDIGRQIVSRERAGAGARGRFRERQAELLRLAGDELADLGVGELTALDCALKCPCGCRHGASLLSVPGQSTRSPSYRHPRPSPQGRKTFPLPGVNCRPIAVFSLRMTSWRGLARDGVKAELDEALP